MNGPGDPSDDRTVMAETVGAAGDMRSSRRSTALAIGDTLNGIYRVDRFVARGGMGEVFEGTNVASHERVAIKAMRGHLVDDPKVLAMFRKEAQILTRIGHPAIVQYRVFARDPDLDLYYLVTDFIDGEPLSSHLDGAPIAQAGLVEFGLRLGSGLQAAHEFGAVHRDMSPDNILLPEGRMDRAKIIDFGIAKSLDVTAETVVGEGFAGKLGFVAPEQFGEYDRQIGPWTDVYSTALVLLSLARGRAPDMGRTLLEAIERRRDGPDLSGLQPPVQRLLRRMLAPDPAHRIRSMAEVLDGLNGLDGHDAPLPSVVATRPEVAALVRPKGRGESARPGSFAGASAPRAIGQPRPGIRQIRWLGGAVMAALTLMGGALLLRQAPADQGPVVTRSVARSRPPKAAGGHLPASSAPSRPGGTGLPSVLAAVPCAWLRGVSDTSAGTLKLYGEAPDPESVSGRLNEALRAAGQPGAAIVTDGVRPMPPVRCRMVEALRMLERPVPGDGLKLITAGLDLKQQSAVPGCGRGLRTALNVGIVEHDPRRYFALFGLAPSGELHLLATGPSQLVEGARRRPGKYQDLGNGEFRVRSCYKRTGTLGLILIDGSSPIDLGALSSLVGSTPGGTAGEFLAAASAGDWRTRSLWLSITSAPREAVRRRVSAPARTGPPAVATVGTRAALDGKSGSTSLCQRYDRRHWRKLGVVSQEGCISQAFASDCDITYALFGSVSIRRVGEAVEVERNGRWVEVARAPSCRKRKRWLF